LPLRVSCSPHRLAGILALAKTWADRDEALRDDFRLEAGSYDYADDEEWGDDDANWAAEDAPEEEEPSDVRDESTAYLEFLNEEVSHILDENEPLAANA